MVYVKMLDGPFTGQVRDLRGDVALDFIRDKRAERAFQDAAPAAAPVAAIQAAATLSRPQAEPAARRRKGGR